jgi:transposase-like protein
MPQLILPMFSEGMTHITSELAFEKRDGRVTYFHGVFPVFQHTEKDVASFRMITSQLCVNGHVTQAEVCRAFGIPAVTMKRAVALFRKEGTAGFFKQRRTRGPAVLTEDVLEKSQELLDAGLSTSEVAQEVGVKRDTLRKAAYNGRLHRPSKKKRVQQTQRMKAPAQKANESL